MREDNQESAEEKGEEKQHVIFLGAGASKAAGLPVTQEFFSAASEMERWNDVFEGGKAEERFERALKLRRQHHSGLDIERLYILLDLKARLEMKQFDLTGADSWTYWDLKEQSKTESLIDRELLRYLITRTLIAHQDRATLEYHTKLIEKLAARGVDNFTIITTNWDTLLEQAIEKATEDVHLWYFSTDDDSPSVYDVPTRTGKPSLTILKMHGAVNWWICRDCGHLDHGTLQETIQRWDEQSGLECPDCEKRSLAPAMIPPLAQKFGTREALADIYADIWNQTQYAIRLADQIDFVGYSVSPIDVEAQVLFQDALRLNTTLDEVRFVTSPGKLGSALAEFEDRVSSLFPPSLNENVRWMRLGEDVHPMSKPINARVLPVGFENWVEADFWLD